MSEKKRKMLHQCDLSGIEIDFESDADEELREMSQFKSPDDTIVSQSGEVKEYWPHFAIDAAIECIRRNEPGLIPLQSNLLRTKTEIDKLRADAERFESKYVKACSELADVEADLATCVSALVEAKEFILSVGYTDGANKIDDVVAKVGM